MSENGWITVTVTLLKSKLCYDIHYISCTINVVFSFLTQIGILLLAELPPAAEAEVHPRIARVVVAALDGLVRVVLVAEAHEAVIVPETSFIIYE